MDMTTTYYGFVAPLYLHVGRVTRLRKNHWSRSGHFAYPADVAAPIFNSRLFGCRAMWALLQCATR